MVLEAHILLFVTVQDILKKNPHRVEMTKNSTKRPKSRDFVVFKKITSLVLFGIGEKGKFLSFINIMQNIHAMEIFVSQVIAKSSSRNFSIL